MDYLKLRKNISPVPRLDKYTRQRILRPIKPALETHIGEFIIESDRRKINVKRTEIIKKLKENIEEKDNFILRISENLLEYSEENKKLKQENEQLRKIMDNTENNVIQNSETNSDSTTQEKISKQKSKKPEQKKDQDEKFEDLKDKINNLSDSFKIQNTQIKNLETQIKNLSESFKAILNRENARYSHPRPTNKPYANRWNPRKSGWDSGSSSWN